MKISTPLDAETLRKLKAGDMVLLSGIVYTARDAAHKRLAEMILPGKKKGKPHVLPVDLKNQVLYYTGPAPAKPGKITGPAGPTTSGRMDKFTPLLLKAGVKGMIGKGDRSKEVIAAIKKFRAVYFIAVGGAASYLSKHIKKVSIKAFKDMGPEAVYRMELKDFPLIVGIDSRGKNIYRSKV